MYHGTISDGHYPMDINQIVSTFYKEMYTTGISSELSFENEEMEEDKHSLRNKVSRDFGIQKENYQHAKILSSPAQWLERIKLMKYIQKEQ